MEIPWNGNGKLEAVALWHGRLERGKAKLENRQ
jgi:hypothetical protein